MKKLVSLLLSLGFLIVPNIGRSLESDQFMMWGRNLRDLSSELNDHMNSTIEQALEELAQQKKNVSCEKAHDFAIKKFRGFLIQKVEIWLEEEYGTELYPDTSVNYPGYFRMSIYNFPHSVVGRYFPMGRNLNFNGIIIGTDKLAHFFSTGLRYFNIVKQAKKKGLSEEQATIKAINYGISLERTILGFWPSGVFSWGDLEANYQGLQMNSRFCEGENSFFAKDSEGHWRLANRIDMKNYINPNMDETFNRSYFGLIKWLKVKPMLMKYCTKENSPKTLERMEFYRSIVRDSFSVRYLKQLEKEGDRRINNRQAQSFEVICPK